MTITAVVFNGRYMLGVITLAAVPHPREYIQIPGQKYIGWSVDHVVYLDTNSEGWDILVGIGTSHVPSPTVAEFNHFLHLRINERSAAMRSYRKAQAIVADPDEVWARRKDAYEMSESGLPRTEIGKQMGISASRVSELIRYWREVLETVENGPPFDDPSSASGQVKAAVEVTAECHQ